MDIMNVAFSKRQKATELLKKVLGTQQSGAKPYGPENFGLPTPVRE
jgi:hypothetical protein